MVSTRKRKERRSPRFTSGKAPDAARSNLSPRRQVEEPGERGCAPGARGGVALRVMAARQTLAIYRIAASELRRKE
jgi:hypothetical protein